MEIKDLTDRQLLDLRKQICLGSIFLEDYKNNLGIDPSEAMSFFDGYCEYLEELSSEGGSSFDSAHALLSWRSMYYA